MVNQRVLFSWVLEVGWSPCSVFAWQMALSVYPPSLPDGFIECLFSPLCADLGHSLCTEGRLRDGGILLRPRKIQGHLVRSCTEAHGTGLNSAEDLWSKWKVLVRKQMEAWNVEVALEGCAALPQMTHPNGAALPSQHLLLGILLPLSSVPLPALPKSRCTVTGPPGSMAPYFLPVIPSPLTLGSSPAPHSPQLIAAGFLFLYRIQKWERKRL